MSDLEEGELESDEDTGPTAPVQVGDNSLATVHQPVTSKPDLSSYRQNRPTRYSSSDESSNSDDDDNPVKNKKRSQTSLHTNTNQRTWSNPNTSRQHGNDNARNWNSGPGFWRGEMGDPSVDRSRINNFGRESMTVDNNSSQTTQKKKKKNNIWGSVLEEQSLTQTLGHVGVMNKDYLLGSDRNVESYDYRVAREDVNDEPEESGEPGRRGMKRKFVPSRLGQRKYDKEKCRDHIAAVSTDPPEQVWKEIARVLKEKKECLIERVVTVLGNKKSLEMLYLTEDMEDSGGLWTMDGSRRRTPGGVFLQLLKSDDDVTKEHLKEIFLEENKLKEKERKKARAYWRRQKTEHVRKMQNKVAGVQPMSGESDGSEEEVEMDPESQGMDCAAETTDRMNIQAVPGNGELQKNNISADKEFKESGNGVLDHSKQDDNEDGLVISVDPYELETFS